METSENKIQLNDDVIRIAVSIFAVAVLQSNRNMDGH